MSIVKDILSEEYDRLKKLLARYSKELSSFPKGSISVKNRNGVKYCYKAHREGQQILFEYIGKESSKAVKELDQKIKRRKILNDKIKKIKENIKEIERSIGGKKK